MGIGRASPARFDMKLGGFLAYMYFVAPQVTISKSPDINISKMFKRKIVIIFLPITLFSYQSL